MDVTTPGTAVRAPDPVDWATAKRVARFVAGHDPLQDSYLAASLQADFDELTVRAEGLVSAYTGLRTPDGVRAQVLERLHPLLFAEHQVQPLAVVLFLHLPLGLLEEWGKPIPVLVASTAAEGLQFSLSFAAERLE